MRNLLTLKDYWKARKHSNSFKNGIYRYEGIQIGVRVSKNENIPSGFMNPKAHKEFINNIFETSPYSSD